MDRNCETCNALCSWDEVDENGDCYNCQESYFNKMKAYWEPLYKAETVGLTKEEREEGLNMRLREMKGKN